MSNYNEYLHGDFKQLGFPNYIKMLDTELRLKDVSFLFTRENLPGPPFFGKYDAEFRFAIAHPSEDSGKRPFIAMIQTSLFHASIQDRQQAMLHSQFNYWPVPDRQALIADILQALEDHLRQSLSVSDRITAASRMHQGETLTAHVKKRC
jgi:hypothetical protein